MWRNSIRSSKLQRQCSDKSFFCCSLTSCLLPNIASLLITWKHKSYPRLSGIWQTWKCAPRVASIHCPTHVCCCTAESVSSTGYMVNNSIIRCSSPWWVPYWYFWSRTATAVIVVTQSYTPKKRNLIWNLCISTISSAGSLLDLMVASAAVSNPYVALFYSMETHSDLRALINSQLPA